MDGMKLQFSLRRFLVATVLVGIGCAFLVDFVMTIRRNHFEANLFEAIVCLPLIGAGLSTPARRTGLGVIVGFGCFVAVVIFLIYICDGFSYPSDVGCVLFLLFLLFLAGAGYARYSRNRPPL
jgi:hypothetical protein